MDLFCYKQNVFKIISFNWNFNMVNTTKYKSSNQKLFEVLTDFFKWWGCETKMFGSQCSRWWLTPSHYSLSHVQEFPVLNAGT